MQLFFREARIFPNSDAEKSKEKYYWWVHVFKYIPNTFHFHSMLFLKNPILIVSLK